MAKYHSLYVRMEEFAQGNGVKWGFDKVDKQSNQFAKWMQEIGRFNSTIHKTLVNLKGFCRWAIKEGTHNSRAFEEIDTQTNGASGDPIFLTVQELASIEQADLSISGPIAKAILAEDKRIGLAKIKLANLSNTKDIFLFSCYTGQRYGDIRNLKWGDIQGEEWHLYQIKGNKPKMVNVPLIEKALALIQKQDRSFNYVLNTVSDQRYNDSVKELARLCGLNRTITRVRYSGKKRIEIQKPLYEWLSAHKTRSTFITMMKNNGFSDKLIMSITGQEDIRTMMRYQGVTDNEKAMAVREAFG